MAQQPPQQPYNPQQPPQQPYYPQPPPPQYQPPPPQYYQQPQQPPPKKRGIPKWLIIGVIVMVLVIIAAAAARPNTPVGLNTPTRTATSAVAAIVNTPVPDAPTEVPPTPEPPTAVPLAPPFADIAAQKEALTDAQWDEYAETLKGLRIENWEGTILNVDQKVFSDNYWVDVDMDNVEGFGKTEEAKVEVTKEDALTLSKGQIITFSGIIDSVNCVLTYCPIEVTHATFTVK